jgi:hypothetical protein
MARLLTLSSDIGTLTVLTAAWRIAMKLKHNDLNTLQGLAQDSRDFLQTQAARCVATDDPRLAQ